MTLRLTGQIIAHHERLRDQVAMPWGVYRCAEAARSVGWSWGRMARWMRRLGLTTGSVVRVRIGADELPNAGGEDASVR